MSKFKHALSNKVSLIYQFLCSPAHWVFPIYCFVQIVCHPSCYREMNICTRKGGSCVAVITPLNNHTIPSGSNDSHISQKLWTKLIRWMDQLMDPGASGQFGFSIARVSWKNTGAVVIEGAAFRKRIIILVITRTLTRQCPRCYTSQIMYSVPPRLVPATGLHTPFTATVAQVQITSSRC